MSDSRSDGGPLRRLLDAERRLHEAVPIADRTSALVVRSLLWFLFFSAVYATVTIVR